ncbi:hypothetical protein P9990_17540 [Prescottella equi]|uniref:hypothetical protein n=1 Tax=Rhodococcus hoagii TaxID=43767 RepID=UPI002578C1BB|nr:hypothetical protein [Prescottella equi]WJJ10375.1 hypothetical protein P9990_17540 [Prescottella equi]
MVDHLDDDHGPSDSFADETVEVGLLRDVLNAVRGLATPILAPHVAHPPRVQPIHGPVPLWRRIQNSRDMDNVDAMLAYFGVE